MGFDFMLMRKLLIVGAVFLAAMSGIAKESPKPSAVRERMQAFTDEHVISGSVTIVATKDKVLQLETVGYADLSERKRMRSDHMFWIASMTKPMAGVCVLMLQDEGKLSVGDSVEMYGYRGRDGNKMLSIMTITLADGRVLTDKAPE